MSEVMTVKELNEWMNQVAVDVDAYGGTQCETLSNLNHVISGSCLGKVDEPTSRINKLGEAVEDWYNKQMAKNFGGRLSR